jgi:hypothetical protein
VVTLDDALPPLLGEVYRSPEDDPRVCPDCGGLGELIYGDGGGGIGAYRSETGWTDRCDRCHCTGLVLPSGLYCSAALP